MRNRLVLIPESWCTKVCQILDDASRVGAEIRPDVFSRWQQLFAGVPVTTRHLTAIVSEVLKSGNVKGVRITAMKVKGGKPDPGEVYEFVFPVQVGGEKSAYVKISLRLKDNIVYFYSAHEAEKPYL